MTLKRLRMQINSSEVSFYTDLESLRLLLDSKRHIRGVKMTLEIIVLK